MQRAAMLGQLAWRNLWRNKRRTLIMLGAIAVGAWAMIFMHAFMRGMMHEMIVNGIERLPGYVQLHHPEYRTDPSITNLIPIPDSELAAKFDAAGFTGWASRIRVPAVISSERESRGITLLGVDPARELDVSFLASEDIEGRFLEDVDDIGVVIGRRLADKLESRIGKRVVIMSQDRNNDIADRGFRIVGLFDAGMKSLEENFVFAGKGTIQAMLKTGDRVSEVAVSGDDYRHVEHIRRKALALVSNDVEVNTWQELDKALAMILPFMDSFILIWGGLVFIALSFGLANTLVMAVFERVREIGLMLALGMKPALITGQIIVESMFLLALGVLIGDVLGWLSIVPLRDGIEVSGVEEIMDQMGGIARLVPQLVLKDVVISNVFVLMLGLVASLSPAVRASRYNPIDAIIRVKQ